MSEFSRENIDYDRIERLNRLLPIGWSVYTYETKTEHARFFSYEERKDKHVAFLSKKIVVQKNNSIIEINSELQPFEKSIFYGCPTKQLHLTFSEETKENEDICTVLQTIRKLEYPDSHYEPKAIRSLFTSSQLTERLQMDATILYTPILELDATVRVKHVLLNSGLFECLFDIVYFTKDEMDSSRFFNMGEKDMKSIYEAIDTFHLPWNIKEKLGI